jgi:GntR family transcriptional regulator, transcriptional repressor for pyruvate dehydrogenase complex
LAIRGYGSLETDVLRIVGASAHPIGARNVAVVLRRGGVRVSEATVSRVLRKLDDDGMTTPTGKGRAATPSGRQRVDAIASDAQRSERLNEAVDVQTLDDLLGLLAARRGVEREAAREAACSATEDDIRMLEGLIDRQRRLTESGEASWVVAASFHRCLGRISGNKILAALTDIVFDAKLDPIEGVLDAMETTGHTATEAPREHETIVAAIRAHDPDAAEEAMVAHLNRLVELTRRNTSPEQSALLNRVLSWALRTPRPS